MADQDLRSALNSKDKHSCYKIISTNLSGKALINYIYEMLYASASIIYSKKHNDKLILHPVCVINAIKNFIGDDKENPSKRLMKFAIDYLQDFEFRIDDEENLDKVLNKGIGKTVFVGEFEDACQDSDWEKAEILMSKIFLASDRSRSILDTLAGLALQSVPKNGVFVYHLLRSFQFQENKNDSWTFIKCIFQQIKLNKLENVHKSVEIIPDNIRKMVIQNGDIIVFSAIDNIWNGDYVRIRGYRRELSYWLNEIRFDKSDKTNLIDEHFFIDFDRQSYVSLAERIINEKRTQSQKANSLIILEAIRSLCKNIDVQGLSHIGSRFGHLLV